MKGIYWILVATLVNSSSSSQECPLENPLVDILLPHEFDCGKFYKCDRGKSVVQNCPEGLYFNSEAGYCDWPENVQCKITSSTPIDIKNNNQNNDLTIIDDNFGCPFEYTGRDVLLSHPHNCSKFLHCDHGQPVEKDCPARLYFNSATDRCDWPHNVKCNSFSITSSTTVAPTVNIDFTSTTASSGNKNCPQQLFPHESDCTKFYECNSGKYVIQSCPVGMLFNTTINACEWPEYSYCYYLKRFPLATPLECNSRVGFVQHEYDCQLYYVCGQSKKQIWSCEPGSFFNPHFKTCENLVKFTYCDEIYTR